MDNTTVTPDFTGSNPQYRQSEPEIHDFGNNITRRVLIPKRGAFYVDSESLYEKTFNRPLVRGLDYEIAELVPEAVSMSGKEVSASIIIINSSVTNPIELRSYQFVGGYFSLLADAAKDAQEIIDQHQTYVDYKRVVGIPEEGLPPMWHPHGADNTFNWWGIKDALDRLAHALEVKHDSTHQLLINRITSIRGVLDDGLQPTIDELERHAVLKDNPHRNNAESVNAYTKAETDSIIDQYYNLNETVANSDRIVGKDLTTVHAEAHNLLPPNRFTIGVIDPNILAPSPAATSVLTTQGWMNPAEVLNTSPEAIFFGASTEANIIATLANYPVGTRASYLVLYTYSQSYGNGGIVSSNTYYRRVIKKVGLPNLWQAAGG